MEAWSRKTRLTHDLEELEGDGGFDVIDQGIGCQGNYEICGKCGGTHGLACHKFRCLKCGERVHVHIDCKKD